MWFLRSCTSESDGLPIEYCERRIGRTEFRAVVTFLIYGTVVVTVFTLWSVLGFLGWKGKFYERSLQALLSLPHRPLSRLLLHASRASTFHNIPKWRACSQATVLTDWLTSLLITCWPAKLLDNCLDWLYDKLANHLSTSWVNRSLSWLTVWKTGSSLVDQQNDYTTVSTDCLTNWLITCWPAEL